MKKNIKIGLMLMLISFLGIIGVAYFYNLFSRPIGFISVFFIFFVCATGAMYTKTTDIRETFKPALVLTSYGAFLVLLLAIVEKIINYFIK